MTRSGRGHLSEVWKERREGGRVTVRGEKIPVGGRHSPGVTPAAGTTVRRPVGPARSGRRGAGVSGKSRWWRTVAFTPPERGLVRRRGGVEVGKAALLTASPRGGGGPDRRRQQGWREAVCLDSLEIAPRGFADPLDVGCGGERGVRGGPRRSLNGWEDGASKRQRTARIL